MPELAREGVAQRVGAAEALHGGLLHHGAVLEHGHAVGHAQGEFDVVRDEHDAAALVGKGAQVGQGLAGQVQVEAGRGLVGHDEARLVHEGAAQKHAARHAAGKLVGVHPRDVLGQAVAGKELLAARLPALLVLAAAGEALHLLAHTHEGVEVCGALRHQADAVAAQLLEPGRIAFLAVKPDAAGHGGVGLVQAQDGVCQQALARA